MSEVAWTSRKAYEETKPKLGRLQRMVYEAIGEMGVASNETLADYLRIPLSSVCGRVNELRKFGMVGCDGVSKTKFNKTCKVWGIRDPNDRRLIQMSIDDYDRVKNY